MTWGIRRLRHYVLVDKIAVPTDFETWCNWYEKADRRVALTITEYIEISTVFLGLDHNFSGEGPPILFETMAFRKKADGDNDWSGEEMTRCSTWYEAIIMHEDMCRELISKNYMTILEFKDGRKDLSGHAPGRYVEAPPKTE